MKIFKLVLIAFCLLGFGTGIIQAQNLDRVAISSGGISSDTLNATIGEIFVFSINSSGISLDAGSQSDQSNTGGLINSITQTKSSQSEILIYPNPVIDYLNLKIEGINAETISFQIYDVAGKLIMQHNSVCTNNLYQIKVKQLQKGNYFIQGYTAKGEAIGKIKFIKL